MLLVWARSVLGVSPPSEPRVSQAQARAMLEHQQRVLSDMSAAERRYLEHLLDAQRFEASRDD